MKCIVYLIFLCYVCMFLTVAVFVFHMLSRSQIVYMCEELEWVMWKINY